MTKQTIQTSAEVVYNNTNAKTKTIGEKADKIAEEYFSLYEGFLKSPALKEKAKSLAEHDLVCKKLVTEFALEKLREKIKDKEEIN